MEGLVAVSILASRISGAVGLSVEWQAARQKKDKAIQAVVLYFRIFLDCAVNVLQIWIGGQGNFNDS